MRTIMLVLVLAIFFLKANSQILTIDKTDTAAYQKQTVIKGNVALSFEADQQKKLLLDATNALDLQLQHARELLILAGSYRFTYNDGEDFLNAGYLHLRWRHNYKNTWQPESFFQYQWDNARGMLHRFVGGENFRYNFWHKKEWEISVASAMYENETWNYRGADSTKFTGHPADIITHPLKSSNYIRWEGKLSSISNVSCVVFYQTPFRHIFQQYRLASNFKLDVSVANHLDLTIALNGFYDSKPLVPINKFYYNLSNSVVYKLGS